MKNKQKEWHHATKPLKKKKKKKNIENTGRGSTEVTEHRVLDVRTLA
jgi:hypothetical protein